MGISWGLCPRIGTLSVFFYISWTKPKDLFISGSHLGAAAWKSRFCRRWRGHNSHLSPAYLPHALPKMKIESGPDIKPLTLDPVPTDVQYGSAGLLFQWWGSWQKFWYFEPSGIPLSVHFKLSVLCGETRSSRHRNPISASQHVFSGSIWSSAWEFTCLAAKKILCQEKSEHLSGEMRNGRRCGRLGIEKAASGGWCLHLLHSVIMGWVQSKQIRAKFEARTLLSCKICYVSPQRERLKSVIPPLKKPWAKRWSPKVRHQLDRRELLSHLWNTSMECPPEIKQMLSVP